MLGSDNKEKIASNILNDRHDEFSLNNSELDRINNQLGLIEKKEQLKDNIRNTAGNVEKTEKDHDGNPISINGKIDEVKGRKHFPYNIPIIGWILMKLKVNALKNKRTKKELELIDRTGARRYLNQNDLDMYKNAIVERDKENTKIMEKYGKILQPVINFLSDKGIIDAEQQAQINNEFKQIGIEVPANNKILTEEQWKKLEKLVEEHKKEEQAKSQSPNAEQKQKEQAKEEGAAKKPDPKALENDKANQTQTERQKQVTKEVMQQKNGVQQTQTQPAQTSQTQTAAKIKNIDINVDVDGGNKEPAKSKETGMQIVAGEVNGSMSAGVTGVGKGQSQGKSSEIQI